MLYIYLYILTTFCNLVHGLQNIKAELRENSREKCCQTEIVDLELRRDFMKLWFSFRDRTRMILITEEIFYMMLGTTVTIMVFVA